MHQTGVDYICNKVTGIKVLSKKELRELIIKYRAGDQEAGTKIMKHNIKYVIKIAGSFVKNYGVEYEDAIGWGIVGLSRATQKFDPDRGYTFSTYARYWIIQAIGRHCVRRRDLVNTKGEITKDTERFKFVTIDNLPQDRNECIKIQDVDEKIYTKIEIEKHLSDIPDRERELIKMKFGFYPEMGDMTLRDIGKRVGLSAERVRQLIAMWMRKMKRNKKIRKLANR